MTPEQLRRALLLLLVLLNAAFGYMAYLAGLSAYAQGWRLSAEVKVCLAGIAFLWVFWLSTPWVVAWIGRRRVPRLGRVT